MKVTRRDIVGLAAASIVAISAFASPAMAKDWTSVTIGVEGAFPPFNMAASDGTLSGYDIDVANEVCKRANLKCKLVAQDWDSQIPALTAGKFDAILTVGPNPERRKVIDFTVPYAVTPNAFMVSKSSPLASMPKTGELLNVNDASSGEVIEQLRTLLKGKIVGAPLSTSQEQFITQTFKDDVEVKTYKSSELTDLDLSAGRIDAEFNNIVYLQSAVTKSGNEDFAIVGPLFTGGIMATDVSFGIRKGETDLQGILNKAIKEATADGTLKTLAVKWFKIDVSPKG
jgi:octopine/nopaline transport system substrate-binding protein